METKCMLLMKRKCQSQRVHGQHMETILYAYMFPACCANSPASHLDSDGAG